MNHTPSTPPNVPACGRQALTKERSVLPHSLIHQIPRSPFDKGGTGDFSPILRFPVSPFQFLYPLPHPPLLEEDLAHAPHPAGRMKPHSRVRFGIELAAREPRPTIPCLDPAVPLPRKRPCADCPSSLAAIPSATTSASPCAKTPALGSGFPLARVIVVTSPIA